jgi:hypothetical protein
MAVRYYTRWVRGQFTSKPLRDLLATLDGWSIEVRIMTRANRPKPGLHHYYRGVLLPALHKAMSDAGVEDEYGCPVTEQWVHEHLKYRFLRTTYWSEDRGEYITLVPSLAQVTADQFREYLTRVEVWMVEFWGFRLGPGDEWQSPSEYAARVRMAFALDTYPPAL